MAFGKSKDDDQDQPQGRFVVEDVVIAVNGKRTLQKALDDGDARGYELRELVHSSDKYLLLVWERKPLA